MTTADGTTTNAADASDMRGAATTADVSTTTTTTATAADVTSTATATTTAAAAASSAPHELEIAANGW